ncbi:MAG: DEAD/DEAH box helicase family protein [Alphaproteobacteria bacterium]|nr:DEAD/DEAH box helicase family protein [Alphaproteobacteria bacterium]
MLFEKQQYQQDCVSNIMNALQDSENCTDFTLLPTMLETLDNIPIKDKAPIPRLDILMETGTGKTFTYIQTMYELNNNKEYHKNKFIICVPRLAIRAGVIQNIKLTSDYFFQIYGKRLKEYIYDDKSGINKISQYLRDKNEFSVLILTSASIALKGGILNRRHETIGALDKSPLDAISKLNPIIFIDEPHLLKGDEFIASYNKHFSHCLCLRFGATFPDKEHKLANVAYVLDSISAFTEQLVKKIRVTTIVDENTDIRFLEVKNSRIKISYFKENNEYSKWVNCREDLGMATGNKNYQNISILKATKKEVTLSNQTKKELYKDNYTLDDEAMRYLVRKTIKIHFAKEERLFKQGIKTLSLFFIPNILDFRGDNPRIKHIFEEEYKKQRDEKLITNISPAYKAYLAKDYDDEGKLKIHDGYFSGDKGNKEAKENDGVNLILRDKEKLLSFETPLRFIFSVWALQEGWDNPNIFNICKLATSSKETSRRQQVGRGLRLAVNQEGKRQTIKYCGDDDNSFYDINTLDVIVSGAEKEFIETIQAEIQANSYEFFGDRLGNAMLLEKGFNEHQANKLLNYLDDNGIIEFNEDKNIYDVKSPIADFIKQNLENLPPALRDIQDKIIAFFENISKSPIENANEKSRKVRIRYDKFKEFEALWHEITRKAKINYHNIDDDALIQTIHDKFKSETIDAIKVIAKTKIYNHETNEIESQDSDTMGDVTFFKRKNAYAEFIRDFSKAQNLPLHFIMKIFNGFDAKAKTNIQNNPKRASNRLQAIIKQAIHAHIVQKISYQFSSDIRISNDSRKIFYDENTNNPITEIKASKLGRYHADATPNNHYLYDTIMYDSIIEKNAIIDDPTQIDNQKITVFAKLPHISIPTPYKNYNPDFAYYIENANGKKLFLIVETKGYDSEDGISTNEGLKIQYAESFFASLNEIMQDKNTKIIFRKRINTQTLHDLLQNIVNGAS